MEPLFFESPMETYVYIYLFMGWGSLVQFWGDQGPTLVLFLFYANVSGMRPRSRLFSQLWRYRFPGFSPALGGISPCLNGSTLGHCLPFPCGEYGGWAKTHHFFFTPTFPWFPVFPLLLTPQRYSTFECCLLGLLFNNNNNNIFIYPSRFYLHFRHNSCIWSYHRLGNVYL